MAEPDLHLKLDRILARQEEQARRIEDQEDAIRALVESLKDQRVVLDAQTEMLRILLDAAGDEGSGGGELAAVIAQVKAQLGEMGGAVHQVRKALRELPGQVEAATIAGVRLAIGDGVDVPTP